jgi:colanic acid/amylovoran biosynthesis glycosyltransferase
MSRFPALSETFILREMTELERQGWEIRLYPLIFQREPIIHEDARGWMGRARRSSLMSRPVAAASLRRLARGGRGASALWLRALRESRSSFNLFTRVLALFPQATYMAQQMQREGVTHIHAHYATHPALVAWLIHHLTNVSYSVTVHAHDIFVHEAMLATKLRDASFVASISEYNRDYLSRVVGPWIREKTEIVHCGIEPDRYMPRNVPRGADEPLEIISTGSLRAYKGHPYLIEACAILRSRGVPFRCRIIGEGEERPALERMIREAGLEQQVLLLGAQSQEAVAGLLSSAHCYAQPSTITPSGKMEGIPVSIMEALACKLPVIATAISGIPELVRPGDTGILVPPADAAALADALTFVYQNQESAHEMAARGREHVLREFSLAPNVARLAGLFQQVVDSHTPEPGYRVAIPGT